MPLVSIWTRPAGTVQTAFAFAGRSVQIGASCACAAPAADTASSTPASALISEAGCRARSTRLVGSLKNSIALSELFIIQANSRSRHSAMPGCSLVAISF